MTIQTRFELQCSQCGRQYKYQHDTIRDLLKYAHKDGWVSKEVKNGSTWDFCPKCVAEKKHEE